MSGYSPGVIAKRELALAKPTVDQMLEINRLGVCVALAQGRLRPGKKDSSHIFLASENYSMEECDEEGGRYSTHKFIGRIAKVGYHRWSMRIAEARWVRGEDDPDGIPGKNQDGYRASYMFEWSRAGVMYARRHLKAYHVGPVRIIDSRVDAQTPDNPHEWNDLLKEIYASEGLRQAGKVHPNLHTAVRQFSQISRGDCDLLIADMASFSELSMAAT